MGEFIPPRHVHPGKGLLSLAGVICRNEPNTGVIGTDFPEAYNWTPLTDEPFAERIEVWNARIEQRDDPYYIEAANFIIRGPEEEHLQIKREYLVELEHDKSAKYFYDRFYDIFASHAHEICDWEQHVRDLVADGKTPLISLRGLDGAELRR